MIMMLQRTRFATTMCRSILAMSVCLVLPAFGQILKIRPEVGHATTIPVSEMPTVNSSAGLNEASAHIKKEAPPARRIPLAPGLDSFTGADPVHQQTAPLAPAALAPALGLGFDGLGNASLGFTVNSAPPDTNGAVGATQFVQWVNSSFAVFNKTTGATVSRPPPRNTLFPSLA